MLSRLREGTRVDGAVQALHELAMNGRNVASAPGLDLSTHINTYLLWVNDAEAQLHNWFVDTRTLVEDLHSEHFWRIRDLQPHSPRAPELINGEVRRQANRLDGIAERLERFNAWVQASPMTIAVLDTHVLLHYEPPAQIFWQEVIGVRDVRLVVPLRVLEELDQKKYAARADLAKRARQIIGDLRRRLGSAEGNRFEIRDGAHLDIFLPDEPRQPTVDADQEILEDCYAMIRAGGDVRLVSDDASMDIRARAYGIQVCSMPEKYLRHAVTQG